MFSVRLRHYWTLLVVNDLVFSQAWHKNAAALILQPWLMVHVVFFIDLHITYTTILWASFFVWRALDMFSLVNIDSGSKSNILWKFLCNISFHNHHLQAHVITIKKIGRDQVKLFAVHSFFFQNWNLQSMSELQMTFYEILEWLNVIKSFE